MTSSAPPDIPVKAAYWHHGKSPSCLQYWTHVFVGFAKVNPDTGEVTFSGRDNEQFQNTTTTKKYLLSIGGDKDSSATTDISAVMRDESKRARFIKDSIDLANDNAHIIDGLDLCWLYPSPSDNPADLVSFLNEWRAAVEEKAEKKDLLLTAAVFHHPVISCSTGGTFNYPCDAIKKKLDWINVMAIDFYTPSNSPRNTGPVHAEHTRSNDANRCSSDGIRHWINNGVAKPNIVHGLSFYGYEWILDDSNNCGFFAPAHPAKSSSPIPYRAIMQILQQHHYEIVFDNNYIAAYAHNSEGSWIGYENEDTIHEKVKVAIPGEQLRGCFAWDVGADDEECTLSRAVFEAISKPPAEANP